jgi:hypothetical protein
MPRTSTSTSKSSSPLETALKNVPSQFRPKVVKCFLDVKRRLAEGNDESETNVVSGTSAAMLTQTASMPRPSRGRATG